MRKHSVLLTLFVFLSVVCFAQNKYGSVKGFVYDKKTGEPMIFTNVRLLGTKMGVQTDENGFFSITEIPPGDYTLFTTIIGYDTANEEITIKAGDVVSKKLFIKQNEISLKGVEVSARKTDKLTHVNIGTTTITPRDMELLPSAGGEPDVAQFLQVVPGVVFTGDQGGQLYIRGGSPAQTGIYMDGATIYNPFHTIGLFSIFETEAIRNVDVQTAGFNAEHGNRTSAIVDVHMIDGNKNQTQGLISVSPLMSRALLQGPLVKAKKNSSSAITYVLAAKYSYLDQTSKSIYGGFGEPFKSGLPYSFGDYYGKLTFSGDNGSKLSLFGFNFNDKADLLDPTNYNPIANFSWQASGGGANFVVSPSSSSTLISGKFVYTNYNVSENEISFIPQSSTISGFEAGINFTNYLPGYSELKYGLEVDGNSTNLAYHNEYGYPSSLSQQNTLASVFVVLRKNFSEKFVMEPSVRFQYYSELSKVSPEPRLDMKYNITENVRIKAAAGIYSQDIISTKNDRDIVNYFTGFFLSPNQTIYDNNGNAVKTNLQTAYHILAGLEVDVNRVEFNLEPWLKEFTRNIVLNEDKLYPSDPDFQAGTGKAYGVDLSAKYNYDRVYLWGVIDYQVVNYTNIGPNDSVQTYPAPFDRRLNVNLLAAYTAGKKKTWELSARYNLGSPFPFTQTQGYNEQLNMLQGGNGGNINTNYLQQNGSINVLLANDVNGGRLTWYQRLDISVKRKFLISKTNSVDATFSVTNVFDRKNIFYADRLTNTIVYQLPIFPSLNVTWHF